MGGKGSRGPSQGDINQQAYAAGASGAKWNDITGQIPFGHDQALQSWMQGRQSGAGAHMPHFAMPHFPSGGGSHSSASSESGMTYEESLAQQQEQIRQAEADRARIEGENRRDSMYSSYMDAAGSAADYVNAEINREMSNAALLGVDYMMDDEMKNTRISDYFASIWGEGEQQSLEALMGQWGNPKGFSGFSVTRGDASKYAGTPGSEESKGTSRGQKPRPTLATSTEEDVLGSKTSVLGV